MHAPTVLLDVGLALGAGFRVKFDPLLISIGPQVRLIQPFLQQVARYRPVGTAKALEAPVLPALANNICLLHRRVVNCTATLWRGTPLGALVHPNKSVLVILLILLIMLRI